MKDASLKYQLLSGKTLLLDGATGTHLQNAGMPGGISPEMWVLDHPDVLEQLQQAYMLAGSDIIYAFTFGANRIKLAKVLPDGDTAATVIKLNRQLSSLSIQARDAFIHRYPDRMVFVAGDLAPTGLFLQPAGDLAFDTLVEIYRQQVEGQLAAGVDLFVVETMMDLAQTRAAIFAVRSLCDRPVMASMTVAENGRTLSGDTPLACLLTCAALGVSAFGLNCSFGPEKLAELLDPLLAVSPIPLLLKPNAGLPQLIDGQTVFPMNALTFAAAMKQPLADGIRLAGGCCGTGPTHIAALKQLLAASSSASSVKPLVLQRDCDNWICSSRNCLQWEPSADLPVIDGSEPDSLIDKVMDVMDKCPALIIDCTGLEHAGHLPGLLQELQLTTAVPFIFRCHQADIISTLLRYYHGRAGLQTSLDPVPFTSEYGPCVSQTGSGM